MYIRALESFNDPLSVDNETLLVFERTLESWTAPNVPNVKYRVPSVVPNVVPNVGRRAQRDIFVWCPTSSNMCPKSYATYIECPTLMAPNVVPNVREVFKELYPTSFAPHLFK